MAGVETGVVLLGPPFPHLHNVPMHHGQFGGYARKWTSSSNQLLVWKYCQDLYQVLACSSEVWISEWYGAQSEACVVRHKLNLYIGSLVTVAYGMSQDVLVGDGQRWCVKHREFSE